MLGCAAVKVLVLGATGGTGRHIVSQALDHGHDVSALIRDRSKLGTHESRIRIVDGEIGNGAALGEAMRGQDAVISAIGRGKSFKSEHLIQRAVPAILTAMQSNHVRRLVFTSAFGVGESQRYAPWPARLFFKTLLRDIYADKAIGDDLIRKSGIEWTIVQSSQLNNGQLTKSYRSGERLELRGMPAVSRADVAHFIVTLIDDRSSIGKTLLISN
jgi:putative NADH-flavin reductase